MSSISATAATRVSPEGIRLALSRLALTVVLLVVGGGLWAIAFSHYNLFDFRVFWDAGRHLLSGQRLYPTAAELHRNTENYYPYPPLVAFAVVPLAILPFAVAAVVYSIAGAAALIAAVRLVGVRDWRCYVAMIFWLPVMQGLGNGALGPFLALALALAWRYRNRRLLGPVFLALAIAAKLFLWPVALWLLATGRIRRSLETVALTAVAVFVPWAVLGFRGLLWYPSVLRLLTSNEQMISWSTSSLFVGAPRLVALGIEALSVALVFVVARRPEGDRRAFSAAVLAALVLSPLVWLHYYVVLLVPIGLASRRFGWLWLLLIPAFWPFNTRPALWVFIPVYGIMTLTALLCCLRSSQQDKCVSGPVVERGRNALAA